VKKLRVCTVVLLLIAVLLGGCSKTRQASDDGPGTLSPSEENNLQETQPGPSPPAQNISNEPDGSADPGEEATPRGEFRGVWVASVLNLDFPSRQNLSAAAMRREIDAIVARTVDIGCNAIIFQVRPTGDSFYESEIFPWSQWLSGTQGVGIPGFDPLAYWIESCHANGIELHAWLNPYRIIHTLTNSSDPGSLAPNHPVRLQPELAVAWTASNGNKGLFLDPGLPEARKLIIDSIKELVAKYDVDGVHIDDYFYPGASFNDESSYARYGNGMDLADWRRENVNELIKGIRDVIRKANSELGKDVRWGVSPTAIWKNGSTDPLGVPTTRGQESYHALYADTRRWVMEEWVDYICPQIYWYIGFDTANFEPILDWWIDLCRDYDVDLYIGHAAYREDQNDQPPHWRGEMIRQLEMASGSDVVKGSVFYRYQSIRGSVGNAIRGFYGIADDSPPRLPVMLLDTLTVGMPQRDTTITATASNAPGYTIAGTSDPDKPLFMNDSEVTNRTIEGFFSVFAPLETGVNEFTFSQEGQEDVTRRITRNAPGSGGGSTPTPSPVITQITAPVYATISSDAAWVFSGNSTSGGSDWMMTRGQRDRVVAESSNGYVRLSCGMWIGQGSVTLQNENTLSENMFKNGVYRTGADSDMVVWQSDVFACAYAGFDGRVLTLNFGMHTEAPPLALPDDLSKTIFSGISSGKNGDTPFIAFTLRDGVKFEGYFTDYEDGEFRLHLKKRKTLSEGNKPLTGISIMLDPGHGGESSGAIGPLGDTLAEKDINLINTFKLAERLTALGATVELTRSTDIDVSVQQRVDMNRDMKPDLFISLHVNSVAETTNSANVRGFSVWYRNLNSVEISQTMLDIMYFINPATNRNRSINQANFFVCRPQWAPSVILEASFIINIDDFVWLIDPVMQDRMADATVEVIMEYFT